MVNFIASALSLLAVSQLVSAAPGGSSFSFESWANSIAKDPEASHPLPEGIVQAVRNGIKSDDDIEEESGLGKRRVACNTVPNTMASVPDAVWCINFLAGRPNQRCTVAAGGSSPFCTHGLAQIVGVSGKAPSEGGTSSSCGDVARAAGRIMDICTRGNTVQGENTAFGNGFLSVNIRRP